MSIQAINWAFNTHIQDQPGAKLVLIGLANFANQNGECWPSQENLASITSLNVRSVRRNIALLVKLGIIKIERRPNVAGKFNVNVYILLDQRTLRPPVTPPSQRTLRPPVKKMTRGRLEHSPEDVSNRNQRTLRPVAPINPFLNHHDDPSTGPLLSSSPPENREADDDNVFKKTIRELVGGLPLEPPLKVTESDFGELKRIGASREHVHAACWVALARRNGSNVPIASFRYFLPIVAEIIATPQPAAYVEFAHLKVLDRISKLSTNLEETP